MSERGFSDMFNCVDPLKDLKLIKITFCSKKKYCSNFQKKLATQKCCAGGTESLVFIGCV